MTLREKSTLYLSAFTSNAGKYGPEKLQIRTFSRSVTFFDILLQKRALTVEAMVVSQVEMRKGEWVQGVEKYEGDL